MSETMSLPRKPSEKKVSEEEGNGKALEYLAGVKVHILKDDNQDPSDLTATTYVLEKEDHTLGNAIRWMVMKDPDVQFCGYSLPHPSEDKLHLRIQTYDGKSSLKVLHEALVKLETHFTQIKEAYQEDFQRNDFEKYQEEVLDMEEIHRQGRENQKRKEKKEREANRSGINNPR